jgi:2-polyprenyl-3-methyl-5-hydroxy-6-metoxy-1,4-benzoquinol methylase
MTRYLRPLLAKRGFHYLATRFGPAAIRAAAFDAKYAGGDWHFHADTELAQAVLPYLGDGVILIMGCGGAAILDALPAGRLTRVLGIDLSSEAIRLARRHSGENVAFRVDDMRTAPCDDGPYDVVLFSESLNYLTPTEQLDLLRRVGTRLSRHGVIVVTLSQGTRYKDIVERIRDQFALIGDRALAASGRSLQVFRPR